MTRKWKMLVIDDDKYVEESFKIYKNELLYNGYDVDFEFMYEATEDGIESILKKPFDALLFDCNFPNSNLIGLDKSGPIIGYHLIKIFRQYNLRSKVIFYSSAFDINVGKAPFGAKEFYSIINELNVFKMVNRNDNDMMVNSIKDAIDNIDIIQTSMERMLSDIGDSLYYEIDENHKITAGELLFQLKTNGEVGQKFREAVLKNLLSYMLEFEVE